MKRTIAAILAIAPVFAYAQTAKSPAQPSSTPVLQSSVEQPAALAVMKSAVDNTASISSPIRISTGVVEPKLLHTVDIDHTRATLTKLPGQDSHVVVSLVVDANGKPTNLKVVKSENPFVDAGVVEAVSQYVFQPAQLNGKAIAVPVTIDYTIQ
jgi:TonB family protein